MITVEPVSEELWLVTVSSLTTTQHRVRLSAKELRRFGGGAATPEQLLKASFHFLMDREPNTAILGEFDLSLIGRYFPEFEREIPRYLKG